LHAFTDIFFLGLLYNMIMGRGRGHLRAFTDNFFLGLLYNMIIFYLFMHLLAVFLPDGVRYFFFSIFSFLGYFFFPFMEFIRFFYLCLKWNFQLIYRLFFNQYIHIRMIGSDMDFLIGLQGGICRQVWIDLEDLIQCQTIIIRYRL